MKKFQIRISGLSILKLSNKTRNDSIVIRSINDGMLRASLIELCRKNDKTVLEKALNNTVNIDVEYAVINGIVLREVKTTDLVIHKPYEMLRVPLGILGTPCKQVTYIEDKIILKNLYADKRIAPKILYVLEMGLQGKTLGVMQDMVIAPKSQYVEDKRMAGFTIVGGLPLRVEEALLMTQEAIKHIKDKNLNLHVNWQRAECDRVDGLIIYTNKINEKFETNNSLVLRKFILNLEKNDEKRT